MTGVSRLRCVLQVIREKEEVAGMLAEESEGRQLLLMEHIQDSERRSDELADEVDRLIKRVLELEQEKKEMEEYKRNELEVGAASRSFIRMR